MEIVKAVEVCEPDAVIIGNLHAANADPGLILPLAERFPTLCVLHDFWLLTGRCAYPMDCTKYQSGCDATCPTPHEYPQLEPEKIADAWAAKRLLLNTRLPILLANSQWTADYAGNALAQDGNAAPRIETLRLSVPTDVFRPLDKSTWRAILGLPQELFILLVTSEFADRRKGTEHLFEALKELQLPNLLVVSTSYSEPRAESIEGINLKRLSYVRDPEHLAVVYSAADLMVGPSLEETFGQVFLEAAACGIPSIGYPVSGVREAILDNVTGRLAAGLGASNLAQAIRQLYEDARLREDLGRWGRIHVENEWSPFSAYRSVFLAFWRLGLASQKGLPRKISFTAARPRISDPVSVSSPPPSFPGLCDWEGPMAEHDLPRFQWAVGPSTRMEIETENGGLHLFAINYRSIHPGQKVKINVNGKFAGDFPLALTGFKKGRWLTCKVEFQPGANSVDFHFSNWYSPSENSRPLALIVTRILSVSHTQ